MLLPGGLGSARRATRVAGAQHGGGPDASLDISQLVLLGAEVPMVTRWRAALDGVATVAMILTSGVLVWTALSGRAQRACGSQAPEAPLPSEPVSLEGAQTQGQPAARLALIDTRTSRARRVRVSPGTRCRFSCGTTS